jgi:hypothetical protein
MPGFFVKLSWSPNEVVQIEIGFVGQQMAILGTAAAPGSPLRLSTRRSVWSRSIRRSPRWRFDRDRDGRRVDVRLGVAGEPVCGSTVTPDVWEGPMKVTGQITAIRTALTGSHLARFLAETDNVELSLLFLEPDAVVPFDFVHVFLPRLKYLGDVGALGGSGPIKEVIPVYGAAKSPTTGYDTATASISTSA